MSDTLSYKGYTARIEFDAEDRLFFGRVADIEDGVGFHADTVEELVAAFHDAVDDYLETCGLVGKEAQRPEPGELRLRVAPELRVSVVEAARREGQSVDQFGSAALTDAIARAASKRLAALGGAEPGFTPAPRRRLD